MRRREFITLLGGAAASAWPVAGRAQKSAKIPRIGIIDDAPIWDHFRQGLRDLGYIDGQNIAFEYRSGEGQPDRLATAASDLVRLPVDIIMAAGSAATLAAQQATTTIPIVMISVGDPVRAGFVASLARPGGNVTGNTILGTAMSAKRLQIFKEVIPGLLRVAFLWNPNNLSHLAYLEGWRTLAPALDLKLILVEVRSSEQFDSAFAAMIQERPDGFLMTADFFHLSNIGWIIDFMAKNRLPAMYIVKENVIAGGLMSYGPSQSDLYRRGAEYAHKILQGTKPTDLPVEQPTKFEMAINLKTARALGLIIPPTLLATADEVIE